VLLFIWLKNIQKKTIKVRLLHFFYTLALGNIICDFAVCRVWPNSETAIILQELSSITTTFLYVVTVVHLIHLGEVDFLLIIIYNHFKQKYNSTQTLGIELGAMYWHFLDFLWVYLFILYFFKKKAIWELF
jgi:cytochrome c oxidase subunit 3